jgi:hypothetical protein
MTQKTSRTNASFEKQKRGLKAVIKGHSFEKQVCEFLSRKRYTVSFGRRIGKEELLTMKPTAYLINIGRGKVVDEATLTRAFEENWIAGAGLDVFVTEPLPVKSRLWELPNVIFSPHVAGEIEDYNLPATRLFADNLRRYFNGKRLRNVIDKKKVY